MLQRTDQTLNILLVKLNTYPNGTKRGVTLSMPQLSASHLEAHLLIEVAQQILGILHLVVTRPSQLLDEILEHLAQMRAGTQPTAHLKAIELGEVVIEPCLQDLHKRCQFHIDLFVGHIGSPK